MDQPRGKLGRPILEIACFNEASALIAAKGGADRIELCRDYAAAGLSPEPEVLAALRPGIRIPIYVMIRPHSEGFCYDGPDFETMKSTIHCLKAPGADGFVFGMLNSVRDSSGNGQTWVGVPRNKELVRLAEGRPCTFHRALDLIPESEWDAALADIKDCGFISILTNGGPSGSKATDCIDQLAQLVQKQPNAVTKTPPDYILAPHIIVGGGVRSNNVESLWARTLAPAFHSAALLQLEETVNEAEVQGLKIKLDAIWSMVVRG